MTMPDQIEIEIEVPSFGGINIEPEVMPKNEIEVESKEKSVIYHKDLLGRDVPDQHSIDAITGLREALNNAGHVKGVKVDGQSVVDENGIAQIDLSGKQNVIQDLSAIRSGASKGSTALQPNDNISKLNNDAGYIKIITSSDVIAALGYAPYNGTTNPNGYITMSALSGYVPTSRKLNGKALSSDIALTSDDIEYTTAGTTCTYVFDLFLTAMESLGDSIGGSFDEEGTFAKASYKTAYNVPLNNIADTQEITMAIGWCDRSIGKLTSLATTEKSNLVGAINEVNSKVPTITFYWGE